MWLVRGAQLVVAATLFVSSSGCLVFHMRERIVREDEPRRSVRFASSHAQRDFNATATDPRDRRRNDSTSVLGVPFVMFYYNSTKLSENAYFNDQLAACDGDGDGWITDEEVLAYQDLKARNQIDSSKSPEVLARHGPRIDIDVPPKKRWRFALLSKDDTSASTRQ
ncbi:MAG TPA: hypothetical protein VND64_29710 [Pirellulales bacterium]|nr:hypothetical protein [Pirellulales bacterium]